MLFICFLDQFLTKQVLLMDRVRKSPVLIQMDSLQLFLYEGTKCSFTA